MFEVNGILIQAQGEDIIKEMREQLSANGIQLFHTIKMGVKNVQFSCPSHKNGQERKPSCGMSLEPTYKGGRVIPAGTVHCFTCGYTRELPEFISDCFGRQDAGLFGNRWLKRNFVTTAVESRPSLVLNMSRGKTVPQRKEKLVIPENVLDKYRVYHDYMYERKLTNDIIELFDVGFDRKTQCLTFPVKDLEGDVVFVQTRSVRSKFHHFAAGVNKTDYVYGAYECLNASHRKINEVWICESILNALTLWVFGIPAIALMGVGGGNQYSILKKLPFRSYVLAMDPDDAGYEATEKLIKQLKRHKLLKKVQYPDSRDINNLGEEVLGLSTVLV